MLRENLIPRNPLPQQNQPIKTGFSSELHTWMQGDRDFKSYSNFTTIGFNNLVSDRHVILSNDWYYMDGIPAII